MGGIIQPIRWAGAEGSVKASYLSSFFDYPPSSHFFGTMGEHCYLAVESDRESATADTIHCLRLGRDWRNDPSGPTTGRKRMRVGRFMTRMRLSSR